MNRNRTEKRLKSLERFCIIAMIILTVIVFVGSAILLKNRTEQPSGQDETVREEVSSGSKRLAEKTDYLPSDVLYGTRLPVTEFTDGAGEKKELSEYEGKMLVMIFWGSWCEYCKEVLENSAEFQEVIETRNDADILLINKLDSEKGESIDKAQSALQKYNVSFDCLYDEDLKAYNSYGIKRIPTAIVLDEEGLVRFVTADVIKNKEELQAILDYVKQGGSKDTENFITKQMTGPEGGIYTNYGEKADNHPSGHDVLSESQGLMMEYAVLADEQELFDRTYDFLKENMYRNGLFVWYVTEKGKMAGANALLDDLRIFRALCMADEQWGGYREEAEVLAKAIRKHNVYDDGLSSFYDFAQKSPGNVVSLCYGDFEALNKLKEQENKFEQLSQNMEKVVQGGYISDEFPLYYAGYDYDQEAYQRDSLNTAEALMTLYHLARAGLLKPESETWLENQLEGGGLASRYQVDGMIVEGFEYETTAVYAIAALIGYESGNAKIFTRAMQRIEANRVWDLGSRFYGGFLNSEDSGNVIAFDQLMPLLLYAYTKDVEF
ncbi:glycosyl hydrolase family 8 [Blautia schinkii]|nr:glycosyl hydrolase family 8 [Blautia schinkii]